MPPTTTISANGIRFTGTAAANLLAQAEARQGPPSAADVLWAARFKARPRTGAGSAVPAILKVLDEALRSSWDACPPLTRSDPFTRPAGKLHGISWDVFGEAGAWRGELIWRHPHPVLAGTPCTSHLVIDEQQQLTTLSLAVAADGGLSGVKGLVGAGQARSPLLDPLFSTVTLTPEGGGDGIPRTLATADIAAFVREVMLDESRALPIAVLAPKEDDDGYLVPPDVIARELLGLAPLYVIDRHAGTFKLTDAIGDRRLSVYWGALRIYQPDFSCADATHEHPLLLRERVDDPAERTALIGRLGRASADRLLPFAGVAQRRAARAETVRSAPAPTLPPPKPASALAPTEPVAASNRSNDAAPVAGILELLGGQIAALNESIALLTDANLRLGDEVARLRTATTIRASLSAAVDRRLGEIEQLLRPETASAQEGREETETREADERIGLVDVVRAAEGAYDDALLILDTAIHSADDSPFVDVEKVGAVLLGMADVARRRQAGVLGTGMKAAFQELGIDYRSGIAASTSERDKQQYRFTGPDGREYECFEHIALGSTYDPRHCLRIYFTSRGPSEPRFVVGHIGRHFTVKSTS